MRILGLDPGLNRTGWGVIDAASGRFVRVDSGMIRVPEGELSARLGHIVRELSKVIERTKPDLASAERVFVNVNPQSTLRLGQARGASPLTLPACPSRSSRQAKSRRPFAPPDAPTNPWCSA